MRKNKLGLITPFAILFFSGVTFANSLPPRSEFDAVSSNNDYVAEIRIKDKQIGPEPSNFNISVFNKDVVEKKMIWSCDYYYPGFMEGLSLLSDDGSTFVHVDSQMSIRRFEFPAHARG